MGESSETTVNQVLGGRRKRCLAIGVAMVMILSSSPLLLQELRSDGQEAKAHTTSMTSSVMTPFEIAWHWAPVWCHDTFSTIDYFVKVNYDGDWNTYNNWDNAMGGDKSAYVYYSFLETDTHFFIGYYDYHAQDYYAHEVIWTPTGPYDVPYSDQIEHENDMEGVMLVVAKTGGYGEVVCMETQAHNDFYQYSGIWYLMEDHADIEGDISWVDEGGHRPVVYVEAGGHGCYGSTANRHYGTGIWHPGFPDKFMVKYIPGETAEVPTIGWLDGSTTCNYALIAIDDPTEGFWQKRGEFPTFYSFEKFRGDDGSAGQDQAANAPWGIKDNDDVGDDISFPGEWFYDPANLFRVHFDLPDGFEFDRTYTWNPFAVELTVVWFQNLWDRDPDTLSDPYLKIHMRDGAGGWHWVLGGVRGTQANWIWDEAPNYGEAWPGITVYGMNSADRSLEIESREWDSSTDSDNEWLMGSWTEETGFVEETYPHPVTLIEDRTRLDWGGSSAIIYVRGDVPDEDTAAPQFASSRCWPSTRLFATDARSIFFQSTIWENVGLSEVQIRFKTNDTNSAWSEWFDTAPCGEPRSSGVGYEFDYTYSMTRDVWHDSGYLGHTIVYQWRATDNDNDRQGDALSKESDEYCGPSIHGNLPDGYVTSVSNGIIALTTDEWIAWRDYNNDDYAEQLIQYYDVSRELVVYTGKGGVYPSVYGEKIAAILNPPRLISMTDFARVEYRGGCLGVYDIPSDTWTTPLGDYTMMYESLSLSGTSLVYGLAEAGSELVAAMDLNRDGDQTDHIIYMFDLSDPLGTHRFVGEGTDPDVNVAAHTVAYMTNEAEVGSDLNKNGRLDTALQFYDYESGERGVIAGPPEGETLSSSAVGMGYFDGTERPFIAYSYGHWHFVFPYLWYDATLEVAFPAAPRTDDGLCIASYSYSFSGGFGIGRLDAGLNMVVGHHGRTTNEVWKLYLPSQYTSAKLIFTGDIGVSPQMSGGHTSYGPPWHPILEEHSLVAQTQIEPMLELDLNSDGDQNDQVISFNATVEGGLTLKHKIIDASVRTAVFSVDYVPLLSQTRSTRTCSLEVTFPSDVSEGIVRAEVRPQKFAAPLPPEGYTAIGPPLEISTTAGFGGMVDVQTSYDPAEASNEDNLRLMQFNQLTCEWEDVTSGIDKDGHTITGRTCALGRTVTVMEWARSIFPVEVRGYVFLDRYCPGQIGAMEIDEFGLGNWRLTLQGMTTDGGLVNLETYTDSYTDIGRYAFTNIDAGSYWVNLSALSGYYYTSRLTRSVVVEPMAHAGTEIRIDFGVLIPSPDPEMPFSLSEGWNLWSCPMTVQNLSAKSLLTAIGPTGLMVVKLDKTLDKYVGYVLGDPDKFDFPILAGEGYYVWSSDATHFTLMGELQPPSSIQLKTGWNIVGYSSMRPMMASDLLKNVEDGHGLMVVSKDPSTDKYQGYVAGDAAKFDFTVSPGNAYYVWADAPSTLAFG